MKFAEVPMLEGYTDLTEIAAQFDVARQTVHYWALKVGAFPGLVRVGTQQPVYLVPADELAAFAAKRAGHIEANTRMRSAEHVSVDPADIPSLPGWMSRPEAAEYLGITTQTLQYLIDRNYFSALRRINRRNVLVLRAAEVKAVHGRRVREWAVAQGVDVVGVAFDDLDKAYRAAKTAAVTR